VLFIDQLHKRPIAWDKDGRMRPQDMKVKLVDFGSAVYQCAHPPSPCLPRPLLQLHRAANPLQFAQLARTHSVLLVRGAGRGVSY